MISALVVITGRSSRRYTTSVVRELECPARRAIFSTGTPESDIRLTNEVLSSRGVQSSPSPAAFVIFLNVRIDRICR
jgi:hypothetical protein